MSSASPIQHVFVLMLENHSFDNMLALSGIPGLIAATPANSNTYGGVTYNVTGNAPGSMPTDPGHEFPDVVEQLCGGVKYPRGGPYPAIDNSGFASNYATTTTEGPVPPTGDIGDIMQCFDTATQLPVMYELATQFVVCDQWFSSLPGPTWPNRFFLHGGSSNGLDHSPTSLEMGVWETVDGFRYPHGSIFDAMSARSVGYRLYHDDNGPLEGRVSQVSSIHGIELWDVKDLSDFANDLQAPLYPYAYTFIEPNYGDVANGSYADGSSQHPLDGVAKGEGLMKQVYEAVRNSPLWESSVLIIIYDEHGGFYDHFPPGAAYPPSDGSSADYNQNGFTFEQYGVRVPAIVVSPWLAAGVDHTVYDHSSVLATLESLFSLGTLTSRDGNASPIAGVLATAGPMRTDCPATLADPAPAAARALTPAVDFAARELEPVPDGSSLTATLGTAMKADSKMSQSATAQANLAAVQTRAQARQYLQQVMTKVLAKKQALAG